MDAFLDLEDPSDWPTGFEHLRELEKLLRCPVCKEYLETPMVVSSCGHTFCSLCVRRCVVQETRCPSCRAQAAESDLYPNRLVESILREFRSGRPRLLSAIHASENSMSRTRKKPRINQGVPKTDTQSTSSALTAVAGCSVVDLSSSDIEQIVNAGDFEVAEGNDSDFETDTKRRTPKGDTAAASTQNNPMKDSSIGSVKCPNCKSNVRSARINWHLDRCLAGLATEDAVAPGAEPGVTKQSATAKLVPLPRSTKFMLPKPTKLAYSLLSEAKLRRTLRELGISSKGDKHQMQVRHVEWVNMYMANADSETPVSHRVLLRRLSAWEDALYRQSETTKTAVPSTPESIAQHASKYADSFAELVAQAGSGRSRRPSKKPV
ncbi:E3 ubiquitin-protein ligase rad18 [Coemansia sp. RSA 485]|nr:E3 ubiquitin-protein ligase rad18 [Coemansia sp. RSA 485]